MLPIRFMLAAALFAFAGFAGAQSYPASPVKMVAAILVLVGGNWIEGAPGRRDASKLLDANDGDHRGK